MTAAEARKLAYANRNDGKSSYEYKEVIKAIEEDAKKGYMSLSYYCDSYTYHMLKLVLEEDGYEVSWHDGKTDRYMRISWD